MKKNLLFSGLLIALTLLLCYTLVAADAVNNKHDNMVTTNKIAIPKPETTGLSNERTITTPASRAEQLLQRMQELKSQGVACSENRVARLMCLRGLKAKQSKRFKATTKRNKAHAAAPNLLKRDFDAERPNQKWLADITYIPTCEGWLYLAVVLDLSSRRIVGWAMSESLHRQLVIDALQMAIDTRQPPPGLLHHSDRGSQYASHDYQALKRLDISQATRPVGIPRTALLPHLARHQGSLQADGAGCSLGHFATLFHHGRL